MQYPEMIIHHALRKYEPKLTDSFLTAESWCCFLIVSLELSSFRTTAASAGDLPSTALWRMTASCIKSYMDTTINTTQSLTSYKHLNFTKSMYGFLGYNSMLFTESNILASSSCQPASAGSLLALLFNPENGVLSSLQII